MRSYSAISILKQSIIHQKQLDSFLSFLPQDSLIEYLRFTKTYNGRTNRSKYELIGLIIEEKDREQYIDAHDDISF